MGRKDYFKTKKREGEKKFRLPLSSGVGGGGGKALLARPLRKELFFAASLNIQDFLHLHYTYMVYEYLWTFERRFYTYNFFSDVNYYIIQPSIVNYVHEYR